MLAPICSLVLRAWALAKRLERRPAEAVVVPAYRTRLPPPVGVGEGSRSYARYARR